MGVTTERGLCAVDATHHLVKVFKALRTRRDAATACAARQTRLIIRYAAATVALDEFRVSGGFHRRRAPTFHDRSKRVSVAILRRREPRRELDE